MHESSGLRFDVYERVHLPQEAADIREIEEIELTPCVQAERQGDQVVLRGSLLLGGVYLPDDESRSSRQLEHWIPVEITLPQERVDRIEDVAVEVDNFDYDLLDGRTLNITGVLTLRGVRAEAAGSRQQTYAWGEEPYTVVHRRGRELFGNAAEGSADESGRAVGVAAQAADAAAQAVGVAAQAADAAAQAADEHESADEAESHISDGNSAPEREIAAEWRLAGDPAADDAADTVEPDFAAAVGTSADAASSGDDAIGQSEFRSGTVQSSGPVEWKTFAAQAQENLTADAGAARQGTDQADERESESDPDPESEQGFLSDNADKAAVVTAESGIGTTESGIAQSERPSASAARSDAQSDALTSQPDALTSQPQEAFAAVEAFSGEGAGSQAAYGKSDLRIAVGAKRNGEPSEAEGSAGIGKLFFPDRRDARVEAGAKDLPQTQEAADKAEQARESADAAHRQASSDEVDWRSLFRGAAAQEAFRKVRLCIVQKDDTLEAIALRYQRNPREIALANRLDDSTVTEGQVLYIP